MNVITDQGQRAEWRPQRARLIDARRRQRQFAGRGQRQRGRSRRCCDRNLPVGLDAEAAERGRINLRRPHRHLARTVQAAVQLPAAGAGQHTAQAQVAGAVQTQRVDALEGDLAGQVDQVGAQFEAGIAGRGCPRRLQAARIRHLDGLAGQQNLRAGGGTQLRRRQRQPTGQAQVQIGGEVDAVAAGQREVGKAAGHHLRRAQVQHAVVRNILARSEPGRQFRHGAAQFQAHRAGGEAGVADRRTLQYHRQAAARRAGRSGAAQLAGQDAALAGGDGDPAAAAGDDRRHHGRVIGRRRAGHLDVTRAIGKLDVQHGAGAGHVDQRTGLGDHISLAGVQADAAARQDPATAQALGIRQQLGVAGGAQRRGGAEPDGLAEHIGVVRTATGLGGQCDAAGRRVDLPQHRQLPAGAQSNRRAGVGVDHAAGAQTQVAKREAAGRKGQARRRALRQVFQQRPGQARQGLPAGQEGQFAKRAQGLCTRRDARTVGHIQAVLTVYLVGAEATALEKFRQQVQHAPFARRRAADLHPGGRHLQPPATGQSVTQQLAVQEHAAGLRIVITQVEAAHRQRDVAATAAAQRAVAVQFAAAAHVHHTAGVQAQIGDRIERDGAGVGGQQVGRRAQSIVAP
ncbi:MAG: hypothetical protein OZX49_02394 [Immundisolibacter sp.]|nr:hypothetical protein [Immundisolibacter sp.]